MVSTGKLEAGQGEAGKPLWSVHVAHLALLCFVPSWMLGGREEDGKTGELAVTDPVPVLWGLWLHAEVVIRLLGWLL